MPVTYNVKPAGQTDGPEGKLSAEDVKAQMFEAGFNPVDISPDGTKIIFEDGQGRFEKSVPELASQFGHQIIGMEPIEPENMVNANWRGAIGNLNDDDQRRMYLEHQIRREHQDPNPNIMGSGRDWYYFNPQSQNWGALTNTSGLDMGDVYEGGETALKMGSSLLGGLAGGFAGNAPGMVAGGAAGSAIAGATCRYP